MHGHTQAFVGLSVTEVVASSITAVAGELFLLEDRTPDRKQLLTALVLSQVLLLQCSRTRGIQIQEETV